MHDFNIKIVLLNEKMTQKVQIIITLERILSLFTVAQQSLIHRNEEKLVALLIHSSFKRVATSGFRINPYSLLLLVFVCRNEDKPAAIQVKTLFRRVAISGIRIIA